jgi:hypothetical protein
MSDPFSIPTPYRTPYKGQESSFNTDIDLDMIVDGYNQATEYLFPSAVPVSSFLGESSASQRSASLGCRISRDFSDSSANVELNLPPELAWSLDMEEDRIMVDLNPFSEHLTPSGVTASSSDVTTGSSGVSQSLGDPFARRETQGFSLGDWIPSWIHRFLIERARQGQRDMATIWSSITLSLPERLREISPGDIRTITYRWWHYCVLPAMDEQSDQALLWYQSSYKNFYGYQMGKVARTKFTRDQKQMTTRVSVPYPSMICCLIEEPDEVSF